jgi:2-polyprenyl-6-methoxyphenol hydroxylase-like FAD-dependent oxidoreductase
MTETTTKTVAILGGGPVGLAAAAHVLERGMEPVVLEAGPDVAHAVRQWGHVRMFSPWEYNVDRAAERLLDAVGWNKPHPDHYPTGAELVEQYLEPLATRTALKDRQKQEEPREDQHQIDQPHDHTVHRSAVVARRRAQQETDEGGDAHGHEPDGERDARAVEHS